MHASTSIRLATAEDVPALEVLVPCSVRASHAAFYSADQTEAALGPAFGVDRQLVADGTCFVAEDSGTIVGSGGWSRRRAVFGGDRGRPADDERLEWVRNGIGRAFLAASERALRLAGFREAVLVATLAGESLYAACGYAVVRRYEAPLPGGLALPVVRMAKHFQ